MKIYKNMMETIGDTPLVRLCNIEKEFSLDCALYAKLERCNPTGSIKDRIAKSMIISALKTGVLKQGGLVIEATSGNTGIGLAAVCASLGLRLAIYMPENASKERVQMMKAYGAEVLLTPLKEGMNGSIKASLERKNIEPGSYIPSQFSNASNPLAHYEGTGPEIYRDLDGDIDCFVASFGTGGTLSGTARFLKEKNKNIHIVGLEPEGSPFASKHIAGPHKIQGIGAGFLPETLHLNYVDEILLVSDEDAYASTNLLARKEGYLCGISSGANLWGAIQLARSKKYHSIVTVFPDGGERYLSVKGLYE